MAQFIAFTSGVEVNGQTILSVVQGMGEFKQLALDILKSNGIDDPQPLRWYSQQAWLDSFKTIAERLGPYTLQQIGSKIPENADWPPQVKTIEDALASIDVAYHMNHRVSGKVLFNPVNGSMEEGIGHYGFKKTGDKEVTMTCNNPYPCDFDKGIILAVAKKFKPKDSMNINLKEEKEKACRKNADDSCIYIVTW
ncbi:MAG: hypothetical protein JW871_03765 [Endomicrobiales bacterium]|nr:hypothetical protein [Endomicrobiales bacterium]